MSDIVKIFDDRYCRHFFGGLLSLPPPEGLPVLLGQLGPLFVVPPLPVCPLPLPPLLLFPDFAMIVESS
jgi:hypothetical protein